MGTLLQPPETSTGFPDWPDIYCLPLCIQGVKYHINAFRLQPTLDPPKPDARWGTGPGMVICTNIHFCLTLSICRDKSSRGSGKSLAYPPTDFGNQLKSQGFLNIMLVDGSCHSEARSQICVVIAGEVMPRLTMANLYLAPCSLWGFPSGVSLWSSPTTISFLVRHLGQDETLNHLMAQILKGISLCNFWWIVQCSIGKLCFSITSLHALKRTLNRTCC